MIQWFTEKAGIWLTVFVGVLAAVGGYKYAAALYEADIADMQAQHALALKEKTDEYRAKEQSQAQQLADAWDNYEKARAESVSLRGDVDDYRARLSAAGSASCAPDRERLASCTKLLEEGAKLSAEGAELAQRIAEKKDALSTMTRLTD